MGMPSKANWVADAGALKKSLRGLDDATKACSKEDLQDLWQEGTLPTGVRDYLLAIRVKVSNRPISSSIKKVPENAPTNTK